MQKNDYILKIKKLLKEKNIPFGEFSEKIGKNRNTLTNYLNGKTKIDIETFIKISEVLGVPVGYFFEGGDNTKEVNELKKQVAELKNELSLSYKKHIKLLEYNSIKGKQVEIFKEIIRKEDITKKDKYVETIGRFIELEHKILELDKSLFD